MDPSSTICPSPTDPPSPVQVAQHSLSNTAPPSQQQNQGTSAPAFNFAYSYPQHLPQSQHLQQSQHQPQLQNWWAQHPQPPHIQPQFQYVQQTQPQNPSHSIVTSWAISTEEWLKKVWRRCVALLVMVGSILAIYYQVRADRRDERNLDYAERTLRLAVWTARKDYCEYRHSQNKDFDTAACVVKPPPFDYKTYKEWMSMNGSMAPNAHWALYGEPTVWEIKPWMHDPWALFNIALALRVCFEAMRSLFQSSKPRVSKKSAQRPPSSDEIIGPVQSVQSKTVAYTRRNKNHPLKVVVHEPNNLVSDPNVDTSGKSSGYYL
ncbi:hypothetical protein E8E13_001928 [Curvularia kusanoi]|uniref:Uncharacterized protein n=1 Tax=Curvularia kusanoi TaxID=90978 RepID=A0A9P4W5Z4_CURKU|nr:hypothetical protein E8E13_001928 [Curvularia kusanoi]